MRRSTIKRHLSTINRPKRLNLRNHITHQPMTRLSRLTNQMLTSRNLKNTLNSSRPTIRSRRPITRLLNLIRRIHNRRRHSTLLLRPRRPIPRSIAHLQIRTHNKLIRRRSTQLISRTTNSHRTPLRTPKRHHSLLTNLLNRLHRHRRLINLQLRMTTQRARMTPMRSRIITRTGLLIRTINLQSSTRQHTRLQATLFKIRTRRARHTKHTRQHTTSRTRNHKLTHPIQPRRPRQLANHRLRNSIIRHNRITRLLHRAQHLSRDRITAACPLSLPAPESKTRHTTSQSTTRLAPTLATTSTLTIKRRMRRRRQSTRTRRQPRQPMMMQPQNKRRPNRRPSSISSRNSHSPQAPRHLPQTHHTKNQNQLRQPHISTHHSHSINRRQLRFTRPLNHRSYLRALNILNNIRTSLNRNNISNVNNSITINIHNPRPQILPQINTRSTPSQFKGKRKYTRHRKASHTNKARPALNDHRLDTANNYDTTDSSSGTPQAQHTNPQLYINQHTTQATTQQPNHTT